jgi:hypothetical protein
LWSPWYHPWKLGDDINFWCWCLEIRLMTAEENNQQKPSSPKNHLCSHKMQLPIIHL